MIVEATWATLLETDLISIYCQMELGEIWVCITLVRLEKYLANFATNNINVWFFTHHILSDPGKLDLIVLQIA